MASTLLHAAEDPGEVAVLRAEVDELKDTVAALRSLAADAYRAEGRPVPPQFAAALPLPDPFRRRAHLRVVS